MTVQSFLRRVTVLFRHPQRLLLSKTLHSIHVKACILIQGKFVLLLINLRSV
jgi:hypothetical protein